MPALVALQERPQGSLNSAQGQFVSLPPQTDSIPVPVVMTPRDTAPSPPPAVPNRLALTISNAALAAPPQLPGGGQPREEEQQQQQTSKSSPSCGVRLNKFVRRLHDMLQSEQHGGIVEWRRGLLVLHSTDTFSKQILPKYFNTKNFKTFRRQLNYYGFVHVRSFSTTGSTTTALWVNQHLAKTGTPNISSVLMLKRVEPCESAKTAEGRRVRKELAVTTVEEDIGVSAKSLQLEQIRSMAMPRAPALDDCSNDVPLVVHCHQSNIPVRPSAEEDCAANLLLLLSRG